MQECDGRNKLGNRNETDGGSSQVSEVDSRVVGNEVDSGLVGVVRQIVVPGQVGIERGLGPVSGYESEGLNSD